MRNRAWLTWVAWALSAASPVPAAERATTTGKVTDAAGKPVEHATVLVYEAHVKKGYSVYCPTCWADCGKHAATDSDGSFTISGLNPDLMFKLLVVKDGFSAVFVDRVDPAAGPAPTALLKTRQPIEDTSQIVRGRVVDGHGEPVRDAAVEQEGVAFQGPRGLMRAYGNTPDWIDLVAVSNEKGEFEMAYGKPAVAMTLRVNARGMAPGLVTETTGPDRKTIRVTEGATIRGRVVDPDARPVAGAEVGLSTHVNAAGKFFPEVSIGTKEDGTFAITNIPAGRIWYIYPKMESLAARGLAGDVELCETKDDGQEVNVGDIPLKPAFTLRGKVVLSDGQPIPQYMHVTLVSDPGADTQLADLQPDGSFEFRGLSKGVYRLSPGVRGYQMPEDATGEVLVDRDRGDVIFRMQPASSR